MSKFVNDGKTAIGSWPLTEPAPTTRETADHIGEANEKVTADHAELARLAEAAAPYWHAANLACGGNPIAVDLVAPFVGAMSPAVCSALLAENAALRADRDRAKERMHKAIDKARDEEIAAQNAELRATEAERKLAEAVGLLKEYVFQIETPELLDEARTFLSKEAERG